MKTTVITLGYKKNTTEIVDDFIFELALDGYFDLVHPHFMDKLYNYIHEYAKSRNSLDIFNIKALRGRIILESNKHEMYLMSNGMYDELFDYHVAAFKKFKSLGYVELATSEWLSINQIKNKVNKFKLIELVSNLKGG